LISSTFQERGRLGDEKAPDFQGAPYEFAKRSFFPMGDPDNLIFQKAPIFSDWKRNQPHANMTDMLCMLSFFLVESVENACKALIETFKNSMFLTHTHSHCVLKGTAHNRQ